MEGENDSNHLDEWGATAAGNDIETSSNSPAAEILPLVPGLAAHTTMLPAVMKQGLDSYSPPPLPQVAAAEDHPVAASRATPGAIAAGDHPFATGDGVRGKGAQPSDFELLTVLGQGQFGTVFQVSAHSSCHSLCFILFFELPTSVRYGHAPMFCCCHR
jgi:hypothetical protein